MRVLAFTNSNHFDFILLLLFDFLIFFIFIFYWAAVGTV